MKEKMVKDFFRDVNPRYIIILIMVGFSIGDFLNTLVEKKIDSFILHTIVGSLSLYVTLKLSIYIYNKIKEKNIN
ncbi:conserved hypothetical protein [Pseudolactococcus piscium]|uniref:hypothetical protein n=1 Tax=Pseudolactococcus carnosus TaxID=2749961 RepID=UPI000812364F|nr:hypothetical protein [Lactococcus carnosus]MCJ2002238.1 hypothetical protein [Lactococcus carnosus]SCA91504.1 conserved hypothetical protein [Lactococcus piscium]